MRTFTIKPTVEMNELDFSIFLDCLHQRFGSKPSSEEEMAKYIGEILLDWMCYLIDHKHNVITNVRNYECTATCSTGGMS